MKERDIFTFYTKQEREREKKIRKEKEEIS
jgi:hypothetical protein